MSGLRNTPLYSWHTAHGATFGEVAGWNMPCHYQEGAHKEHLHTRQQAAIFDLSHMGEILLSGSQATQVLEKTVTANIATLKPNRCRYSFILTEQGTIREDLIIYRLEENAFMLVLSPRSNKQDTIKMLSQISPDVVIEDISDSTAKIDLQGPQSFAVLESVFPSGAWKRLPYYGFIRTTINDIPITISRTGYTGELGVEIYLPANQAEQIWTTLLQDSRIKPAGLDARATLRLEAGLPAYGQDLDTKHTPAEAGFSSMLTSQADYIGKDLAYITTQRLTPLILEGSAIASLNAPIHSVQGDLAGYIASCNYAPCLEKVIALGYINNDLLSHKEFTVNVGEAKVAAKVTTLPFYTKGTARELLF